MNLFKTTLILLTLAFFIGACTETKKPETNVAPETNVSTPAATPDELASGRKNYQEKCARCHKEDGTGGKVEIEGKTLDPENLTSEKMKKEPDEEYIEYMEKGIPEEGMPSFKDELSGEEMKEVVKYIREELQK